MSSVRNTLSRRNSGFYEEEHGQGKNVERLVQENKRLQDQLRETQRKNLLEGGPDTDIPPDAPRFGEFKIDPVERLANPRLSSIVEQQHYDHLRIKAKIEADAFVAANPEYYKCQANFDAITKWLLKNNLAPVRQNFQLAYDKLSAVGLLFTGPTPESEENPPVASTTRVPSGLTRNQSADESGIPVQKQYTEAEIDAMTADVYRRKLLGERGFAEAVERIENERAQRRRK